MKTAEEILRDNCTQWLFLNADEYEVNCIVNAMKEYAKEVAREALKNAARNAMVESDEFIEEFWTFYEDDGAVTTVVVNQPSILDEKNIPEL